MLASAGIYGTLVAFVGLWGVPYLTQVYGLPRVEASNVMALAAAGIMVGGPLIGWVSDRGLARRRIPMVAAALLYLVPWLLLVAPGEARIPVGLLGPACFLLGLSSGAAVLPFACVREVNDPARVGIAIGFCNLPIFLGFALLQWITGAILDSRWEGIVAGGRRVYPFVAYHTAFTLCLGVAVAALAMACLVTETRCRNIWGRVEHDAGKRTKGDFAPWDIHRSENILAINHFKELNRTLKNKLKETGPENLFIWLWTLA